MRSGDDRRYRRLVLHGEAVDEQVLEVAERDAAIDRAAGCEGNDQRVGAPGESLRPLGGILDLGEAIFERGDAGVLG